MEQTKTGAELIAAERQRQITEEGYTPAHDCLHTRGELLAAAECYLLAARYLERGREPMELPSLWPWRAADYRPAEDVSGNLTKSAALIAAELDRLARTETRGAESPNGCKLSDDSGRGARGMRCRRCSARGVRSSAGLGAAG